jgi:hypothetical protein
MGQMLLDRAQLSAQSTAGHHQAFFEAVLDPAHRGYLSGRRSQV